MLGANGIIDTNRVRCRCTLHGRRLVVCRRDVHACLRLVGRHAGLPCGVETCSPSLAARERQVRAGQGSGLARLHEQCKASARASELGLRRGR